MKAPTKAQKEWREAVRALGSVISGGPAVIHHAAGRSAKHNRVEIGHDWIIPLTDEEHKALHNGESPWDAVPDYEGMTRKQFEKAAVAELDIRLPGRVPVEVMNAIQGFHR